MLHRLLILAAFLGISAHAADPATVSAPADIYIFAGQSNMFGTGMSKATVPANLAGPHPGIEILKLAPAPAWVPLDNGVNNNDVTDAWGSEAELTARLAAAPGAPRIRVVKFAAPGSWLAPRPEADWNPASHELLDGLLGEIQAARRLGASAGGAAHFGAFIWLQGESDCNAQAAADAYRANLETLIAALRAAADTPDLPVYLGRVQRHYAGACIATVRAAEARIAAAGTHIALIDTDACPLQQDNIHYTAAGHVQIGDAIADLILGAAHQAPCQIAPGQSFSIRTHAGEGTRVGTVALAQAGTPTPAFSITDAVGLRAFAIDGVTGAITVADPAAVAPGPDGAMTITVEAANGVAPLAHAGIRVAIAPPKDIVIANLVALVDPAGPGAAKESAFTAPSDGARPLAATFSGGGQAMGFDGHRILIGPDSAAFATPGADEDLTVALAVELPATAPAAARGWCFALDKDAAQPVLGITCDAAKGVFGLLCANAFNAAPLGADAKPVGPGAHAVRLRKVGATCRLYIDGTLAAEATTSLRRAILAAGEHGTLAIGGSFAPAPSFIGRIGRVYIVKGVPTTDEEALMDRLLALSATTPAKP
jgi:hypothetical protein